MGRGGRFGKYGEHRRFERLRRGKIRDFIPPGRPNPLASYPYPGHASKKSTRGVRLTFRKANPRDLPFIIKLSDKVFSAYGPYDEIIARWASLPQIITVVVEEKSQLRGFAMINPIPRAQNEAKGELLAIAVSTRYQRRGIGERLLEYMEGLTQDLGIEEIVIHTAITNEAAHQFFAKNGFVKRGLVDRYYPMGQKALEMSKTLSMIP
ncbi:MAG: GNAT family N-acetyltransferase [Syntrophobacterales bacterium]|nr:MAG: GNAT family N-acetyltransferase [Syntrophobacterales bacterium]